MSSLSVWLESVSERDCGAEDCLDGGVCCRARLGTGSEWPGGTAAALATMFSRSGHDRWAAAAAALEISVLELLLLLEADSVLLSAALPTWKGHDRQIGFVSPAKNDCRRIFYSPPASRCVAAGIALTPARVPCAPWIRGCRASTRRRTWSGGARSARGPWALRREWPCGTWADGWKLEISDL